MSSHHFNYITDMLQSALAQAQVVRVRGRVVQVTGTIIRAVIPSVKIGEICHLQSPGNEMPMRAEVVGFSQGSALLMPMGDMQGISSDTEVIPTGHVHMVPVGNALLGRVLDGMGEPMDTVTHGPLLVSRYYPVLTGAPSEFFS